MTDDEKDLEKLLGLIKNTRDGEIDCGAFLEQVAAYVERVAESENAAALMPQIAQHLTVCPECREEFEALLAHYRAGH